MAAIRNPNLGINIARERGGGDKREKDYINLDKSHPHPLFIYFIYLYFFYFLFWKLNFVC